MDKAIASFQSVPPLPSQPLTNTATAVFHFGADHPLPFGTLFCPALIHDAALPATFDQPPALERDRPAKRQKIPKSAMKTTSRRRRHGVQHGVRFASNVIDNENFDRSPLDNRRRLGRPPSRPHRAPIPFPAGVPLPIVRDFDHVQPVPVQPRPRTDDSRGTKRSLGELLEGAVDGLATVVQGVAAGALSMFTAPTQPNFLPVEPGVLQAHNATRPERDIPLPPGKENRPPGGVRHIGSHGKPAECLRRHETTLDDGRIVRR